jgi:hypothetical protein
MEVLKDIKTQIKVQMAPEQESISSRAQILRNLIDYYKQPCFDHVPPTTRKEWYEALENQAQKIESGDS